MPKQQKRCANEPENRELYQLMQLFSDDFSLDMAHGHLINAAEKGHTVCVGVLLALGANVNAADLQSKTALMRAAENGHPDVVSMLLNEGARFRRKDLKDVHASCQVLLNQAKEDRCRPLRKRLMMWSILTGVVLSVPVVVANAKALTLSAVWMSAKSIVSQVMSQGVASLPILAQALAIGALIMTGLMIITGVVSLYQLKSNRWEGVIQKIVASLIGVVCCSSMCLVVMQFIPFGGMAEMTLTTLITSQWLIVLVLLGMGGVIGLLGYRFLNSDSKYLAPLSYDIDSKDHEIFQDLFAQHSFNELDVLDKLLSAHSDGQHQYVTLMHEALKTQKLYNSIIVKDHDQFENLCNQTSLEALSAFRSSGFNLFELAVMYSENYPNWSERLDILYTKLGPGNIVIATSLSLSPNKAVFDFLLEKLEPEKIDVTDQYGYTALMRMVFCGPIKGVEKWQCLQSLIDLGINVKLKTNEDHGSQTALNLLRFKEKELSDDELNLALPIFKRLVSETSKDELVRKGSRVSLIDRLIFDNCPQCLSFLLNICRRNSNNEFSPENSSLITAIEQKNLEIVNILLKYGADVSHDHDQSSNVLYHAVNSGDPEILNALINRLSEEQRASMLNEQDRYSKSTPIILAIQHRNLEMVQVLLNHTVDISIKDYQSRNVLHHAAASGDPKILEAIVNYDNRKQRVKIVTMMYQKDKEGMRPIDIIHSRMSVSIHQHQRQNFHECISVFLAEGQPRLGRSLDPIKEDEETDYASSSLKLST